jgi:serine/threonine protein kinase
VRGALGAGGFGAVYLGHDTQLDRPVAIKVLRARASPAQAEGEPALQEARRLAQLRHPGIVAVHDVGVHEGQVYIVSDYLDGPNLAAGSFLYADAGGAKGHALAFDQPSRLHALSYELVHGRHLGLCRQASSWSVRENADEAHVHSPRLVFCWNCKIIERR